MNLKLIHAAILDGYQRRKDKSVSLRFVTQELTTNEVAEIDRCLDTFGVLYYRGDGQLNKEEVAELDAIELDLYDEPKTQSQRLRNVLYKVHQQTGAKEDWKEFYKVETEKIIQHYKNKLDE